VRWLNKAEAVEIGRVTHFFSKISVAVVELKGTVSIGDRIWVRGAITDFQQAVESMQIEHQDVKSAGSGQSIGLKVAARVREGDLVFKLT